MSKALFLAIESEAESKRLVEIACTHTKLVVEAGRKETTKERREEIKVEIESLRQERESILRLFED